MEAQAEAGNEYKSSGPSRGGRGARGGRGRGGNSGHQSSVPRTTFGPTEPIKPAAPVTKSFPPPTKREVNTEKQNNVSTKYESVFKEAIFSAERSLKPVAREIHSTPSSKGFTPLVNDTFSVYRGEKRQQMGKEFPIELFCYYSACLYWLRVIGIKLSTAQPLTPEEDRVLQSFENRKFCVPELIFLALKAVGKVTTPTGDQLVPDFPNLPHQVTGTYPGNLGPVSTANHNVYEEMPVIGVAIEAMQQRLLPPGVNVPPTGGRAYASVFAPQDTVAN